MSRKDVHKRALQRRAAAESALGQFGLSLQDELVSVGVVLADLGLSQLTFFALHSINDFCFANVGIDVSIFALQHQRPCTPPVCPVLDPQAMAGWRSPLIAVGTGACLEALNTQAPLILHYVWSVDFTDRRELTTSEVYRAFRDPRVRLAVRGEDYRRLVTAEFGVAVHETVVPNFEFDALLRILLPEAAGGKR